MGGAGVVVVGGTRGLGRALAQRLADRGDEVVITGRDRSQAEAIATDIGGATRGLALDLTEPHAISSSLSDIAGVEHLVLAAIDRDANSVRHYDIARAIALTTMKLVGYTEVLHQLHDRMREDGSVLLFGGLAKERPYPGSTTVTSVNGAVTSMVRTFAIELAPIRVNAIHPGIVGDSPQWVDAVEALERTRARTPTRRLPTMADVTDAALMLLENRSINGVNLPVDSGWVIA